MRAQGMPCTLAEAEEMVFEGGLDERVEREEGENDDDCISFHEFVESIVAVHESEVEVEASDLSMHRVAATSPSSDSPRAGRAGAGYKVSRIAV